MIFVDAHVNSIGCVAVVAATNKGQVKNCRVTSGDVCGEEARIGYMFYASAAAGIVADNKGVVLGCSNGASVTCNSYMGIGGIVGRNTSIVMGCINNGTITNTISSGNNYNCGGIVGSQFEVNSISVACGNYGEVSSPSTDGSTGGIVGFLDSKVIGLWTKATTPPDSKGDNDEEADGIGDMFSSASATACYYFNDLSSVTEAAITEMNNAIDAYNGNNQNTVKCNYKWVAVNGGWPTLVINE